jgi:hypothetical protein
MWVCEQAVQLFCLPSLREAVGTLECLFLSVLLRVITYRETAIFMIQTNFKLPDVNFEKSVVTKWYEMANKLRPNEQQKRITEIRMFLK